MNKLIQEIIIYLVVALSSLFIMSYAVHMLVGGLVSKETEHLLIAVTCLIGVMAIGFMVWDVTQRRKGINK
ncbi:MAG: hypothetical protein DID92_2727745473 [Candidatus Nitrotoga sp. SPKER]|nr:MAG: hypothetical protein DID92_2727745473 [Candidatus Nitrotoga sp. SPKER]